MATTMEPRVGTTSRGAPEGAAAPTVKEAARPGDRRRLVFLAMGAALLGLLGFGAKRWWYGRSHVSTDNAQVEGHIVPILPKVGGFVAAVSVRENEAVKAGDTLVVLDDRDFRVRLAQTEASSPTRGSSPPPRGWRARRTSRSDSSSRWASRS